MQTISENIELIKQVLGEIECHNLKNEKKQQQQHNFTFHYYLLRFCS